MHSCYSSVPALLGFRDMDCTAELGKKPRAGDEGRGGPFGSSQLGPFQERSNWHVLYMSGILSGSFSSDRDNCKYVHKGRALEGTQGKGVKLLGQEKVLESVTMFGVFFQCSWWKTRKYSYAASQLEKSSLTGQPPLVTYL